MENLADALIDIAQRDKVCELRRQTANDEAFLRRLFAEQRSNEFAQLGLPTEQLEHMLGMQFMAQRRHYQQNWPHAVWLIAERREQPVGQCVIAADERNLRLVDIAISESVQGQGLGAAVLRCFLTLARELGRDAELSVVSGRPAADWYRRLGFEVVSQDELYESMQLPENRLSPAIAQLGLNPN